MALVVAILLAVVLGPWSAAGQGAPSVTGVSVTSTPAASGIYGPDEVIRVSLTFSEAVNVSGEPRLKIDMDPAEWGEKWAAYEDGSGTASLVFAHTVVEPNFSTQGIAVLANTLALNGGSIRSASSQADAALDHAGLNHNPNHRVDWRRSVPVGPRSPAGADAVAGAPAISSATATLTSVAVTWRAPSSDGGAAITAYDLQYKESTANSWTTVDDIWVTGGNALSYRQTGLTPSTAYDFQVRAVNADGDGGWSATRAATTGTPAISGTATLSYAENAATRVGTFTVTGAVEGVDEVTWAISGTDASHFDITHPKGALRLIDSSDTATGLKRPKLPDYESPDDSGTDNSYSITLSATVGGVAKTLAVTVTVTDADEPGAIALAPVRPKVGTALTATLSDPDTVSGTTTWVWQRSSGRNSWSTISGATSASYTPVAADSGQYLRAKATYTDGHGANKSAEATAHHVVIASVLTVLTAATTDTTLALTPAFSADVLHYKVSCGATDTMSVTPAAATGVRLAVNGEQTPSGTAVSVSVGRDSDVVIRASGSDGGYTDYVVHCVHGWLATMQAIDRGAGDVTESLISFALDGYVAVIDHHGVPRFRREPGATPVFWFRHYRVGSSGEYRWHYTTRATRCNASHHILDEDFAWVANVASRSPLGCTGVHDFRILDNGGYLLMSYEPGITRDISHITLHSSILRGGAKGGTIRQRHNNSQDQTYWRSTQFTASENLSDSAIQILTPSRAPTRTWTSWGAMAYEDCVQHWWDEYAHLNSVQYFEGSVIGSFRGCSKVLSVNASTGRVEWRLGRSNLTDEEWAERNIGPAPLRIVGDPEGEFCGQHAAEMRPDGHDGRLTLFDNGEECLIDPETGETTRTSDEYARAVEYAIDTENGEAVFLRDHSLHGGKNRSGTRGGQVAVLDSGDWLIGWGRERHPHQQATKLSPDEAITQVDPSTGTEKLSFRIPAAGSTFQANVRPSAVPAYVLAPQPVTLAASAPASERTAIFHKGDDDTPQVLVTFNRPIADFAANSPSLSVSGGSISAVSALVADGEPANAYLFTLDPSGAGAVTLRLLTNRACASGGICAADGSTLKTGVTVVVTAAPQVSFARATQSVNEGTNVWLMVRLSKAHQSASTITIPVVVDTAQSTASSADYQLYGTDVTFERGETIKGVGIRVATDTLVEGPETVVLGFGTLPDGVGTGSTTSTTVTLADRTTASIDFSIVDGELPEGASDTFTFAITNGVTFAEDATINLTLGGSATAGTDYTLEAGGSTLSSPYSVTLPAGQSSTSFTLRVTDDSTAEPVDESVTISARVALTKRSLGSRGITIPPSDVPNVPDVTISTGQSSVTEGGEASFTLQRSGDTTAALTVSVVVGGTGARTSRAAPSSVTFAAGSDTATLSLELHDDTVVRPEGGELRVWVYGSSANPPKYLTTAQNRATITVTDNDVASFTVTPSAEELTEGQTLTVTVDTGGVTFPANQDIELRLGGTATAADDYLLPGGCTGSTCSLTLPRGARAARASFRTRYDGVTDGPERIDIDVYHGGSFIGSVSVNLVDGTAPPPAVFLPGGFGGGGGPSGPTPSEADFEWNVERDIEALEEEHDLPTGAWSDGATLWLANNADGAGDAVYAYDLASGERLPEREFDLDARNGAPRGVWAREGTAWASDSGRDRLFAYDLASGERLPAHDIELASRNAGARGLWGDEGRLWVLDGNRDRLFAYNQASGDLLGEFTLAADNGDPRGLWSDGVTVWVSDHAAKRLFAYRLPVPDADNPVAEPQPLQRVSREEFTELTSASNLSPRGIWSDGAVMYVADANDGRVYSYNMPDAIDARLASLVLAGVEFGEFSPLRTEYEGGAGTGVEETTVEAVPAQADATVAIEPPDADGDSREGYQVTLAGTREVTVTVTSPDGSRTRVYRVVLAGPDEPVPPHGGIDAVECLRGPVVAGGFRLVLATEGSVDDLAACAAGRGVDALYALREREWVSYILGAPEFVNGPFRELFAEGLPAGTPLVARGGEAEAVATSLASLTLDGVSFGALSPGRTEYAGVADGGVPQATVEAVASQAGATVAIAPADADGDPANGHQVALEAGATVTITVTSEDGTRTAVYRVWIAVADAEETPDGEPAPDCLRGEIAPGFSLVVHEGGSVEQLAACAHSLGVEALYALADGAYVSYLLEAPDFVNEAFRDLFPHGLPPETPLVAAGR